jgi:hypothetical protein
VSAANGSAVPYPGPREALPAETPEQAPLSVIWPLLGRHIAFHRRLVDLTSSVKAALLLSQSIYWTRHGRDIARNDGWFHKTTEQWALETGLSAKEQAGAREILRNLAVLEDRRLGVPARVHFRLNLDALGAQLADRITGAAHAEAWPDRLVLAELLGPSVAFHRTLVAVAGGVHAGLMLSRALHVTRMQVGRRVDEWIVASAARWFEELGLTRREQETARRDLVRAGLWEEALRGIPPSLVARIRLDGLLALLVADITTAAGVARVGGNPDRDLPPSSAAPKGDSSLRHPRRLVALKPPSQFAPIREHSSTESAGFLMNHSTGESLHARRTGSAEPSTPVVGGAELIFPDGMLAEERRAAGVLLRPCGPHAQALLDELAGRLRRGGVRESALAYLRGLIARAEAGSFVPELGPGVAAARAQREKDAALRREREAEALRLAAERETPEYQARARAQRERVRRLLDELKAPGTGGSQA